MAGNEISARKSCQPVTRARPPYLLLINKRDAETLARAAVQPASLPVIWR
ncbi:hypothetical protein KCP73_01910 [Salmonella enterica subsp. enterica]|nr:hypothetical protein KCP73_01910 [Salmonella enterica subsp. enterica]